MTYRHQICKWYVLMVYMTYIKAIIAVENDIVFDDW